MFMFFFVKRLNCIRKCIDEQYEISVVNKSGDFEPNINEIENGGGENGENTCLKKNKSCCIDVNNIICLVLNIIYHTLVIALLVIIYMHSFNIFFYGMSYVIQFFVFTLFLAVPHFPIQSY